MKLSHKQKVKMARKMQTPEEMKKTRYKGMKIRVPLFQTAAWNKRSREIAERVSNHEIENDLRKQQREMAA